MSQANLLGAWTLFVREVHRFMKVKVQTILAPALMAALYFIVFRYALGKRSVPGLEVDYFSFLIPGLVMMAILQNAFANTSSSIITGKVMNVHIYLLMAPLSALEVVVAFLAAAVVRACVVAAVLLFVLMPFTDLGIRHPWMIILYGLAGSLLMGGLGLIGGMWARKFDEMSLINNFVILPLTFLSGVFYSVRQLPPFWQKVNAYNPFFYLIDGFRYGFLGVGDTQPKMAIWVVLTASVGCVMACWYLWRIGWKLKE